MDYKQMWQDYQNMSFEERKSIVIAMLEELKDKSETFAIVHEYISDCPTVSDQDLQDVYNSIVSTLYEIDEEKQKIAVSQLTNIREKALLIKQKEDEERTIEKARAHELLEAF